MIWHPEVLSPQALEAAQALVRHDVVRGFYLAGGTALALQRGHRVSVDLDFFSSSNPLDGQKRAVLKTRLSGLGGFQVRQETEGILHAVVTGVEVSFLRYSYPLVRRTLRWRGLAVAAQPDIGLMKLGAIIGRGSRKDFRDLREIVRTHPLERLLRLSRRKFSDAEDFLFQASKALVYFADADSGPESRLLKPEPWAEVRRFFEREVPGVFRRLALA